MNSKIRNAVMIPDIDKRLDDTKEMDAEMAMVKKKIEITHRRSSILAFFSVFPVERSALANPNAPSFHLVKSKTAADKINLAA